jgi:excisionase family DNA binding protein
MQQTTRSRLLSCVYYRSRMALVGECRVELLTVAETAQLLRVSPITVRRYISAGALPAHRVGRAIRLRRADVEDFLAPVVPFHTELAVDPHQRNTPNLRRIGAPTDAPDRADENGTLAASASGSDEEDDVAYWYRGRPVRRDDPLYTFIETGDPGDSTDVVADDAELPTMLELLGGVVGIGRSGEPTNIAEHKDDYLAEAFATKR